MSRKVFGHPYGPLRYGYQEAPDIQLWKRFDGTDNGPFSEQDASWCISHYQMQRGLGFHTDCVKWHPETSEYGIDINLGRHDADSEDEDCRSILAASFPKAVELLHEQLKVFVG